MMPSAEALSVQRTTATVLVLFILTRPLLMVRPSTMTWLRLVRSMALPAAAGAVEHGVAVAVANDDRLARHAVDADGEWRSKCRPPAR